MKNKLIEIESTTSDAAKVAQYDDDISEHTMMTPPNFKARPLDGQQAFMIASDKQGEGVVAGVPLENALEPGEVVIEWTDPDGVSKGEIRCKNGTTGTIAIENDTGEEIIDLLSQLMDALATATVATLAGPQPLSTAATIATLKTKLDTFKE